MIPETMAEIEKISQQKNEDPKVIIQNAILEHAQNRLNEALEGDYWAAKWLTNDEIIGIYDVVNQIVGQVTPAFTTTFSDSFVHNAADTLQQLQAEIQEIVRHAS